MSHPKTVTITSGEDSTSLTVGKTAHGLMMMTWRPEPVSDEIAFESIKTSLDSVPPGVKMFINSGEFYGVKPPEANLELLARFFEKNPSYAEKAFLSVKGSIGSAGVNATPENLKRSVDNILSKLRGTKKLDLYECARIDAEVPIENAIETLSGFVKEGKFSYIGMSECSAATLRRASTVHHIAVAEIEISPWSYEEETKKVISTARELGTAVLGYSPLGRGFLTGAIKKPTDLAETDMRRHLTRAKGDAWENNEAIVNAVVALAHKKGVTPAQLCIAWVSSLGPHVIPVPGSSHAKRTEENLAALDITLTEEEIAAVAKILDEHPVVGDRYFGDESAGRLWG